jgi:hypothetical protein
MLYAIPTKRGYGITLYGDYNDLESLHGTIHLICDENSYGVYSHKERTLSIAYKIRKAYERKQQKIIDKEHGSIDYATNIDWPAVLFYASFLRHAAGFCPTTKKDQANLYRFEYCIESALVSYDYNIGTDILRWYDTTGCVSKDFIISFIDEITYEYLYGGLSGKRNFRRLPELLRNIRSSSDEYRGFAEYIKAEAQKNDCTPDQLWDSRDWPEIKW